MITTVEYDCSDKLTKVSVKDIDIEEENKIEILSCSSSETPESLENGFILYHCRWLVLASYCLLSLSAGSSWLCFPAVSNIMRKYYDIGILSVNLLSIIFGIAIVVVSLPFAVFLEKYGLSLTLKLAASLNAIGAVIRYFGANSETGYWFLLVGNFFTSLSVAGFLFLPGKIASTWFGEHEIGTATAVCVAFDALGTGLGFIHATSIIKNSDNMNEIQEDVQFFLLTQLIPATMVLFFVSIFAKKQPKTAPSFLEMKQKEYIEEYKSLIKSLRNNKDEDSVTTIPIQFQYLNLRIAIYKLFKNFNFHLIVHMQGITAAIEGIYELLLNEMLIDKFPGYEKNIGIIGFVAVMLGFATNIVVGMVVDKTGSCKRISLIIFLITSFCCIILSVLMEYFDNFIALSIVFCILMSTCTSYYTIAFTHSSQVTFPISPTATGVMLVLTSQVYDTIVSFTITEILDHFGAFGVNCTAIVIATVAVVLSLIVQNKIVKIPTKV